MAILSNFCSTYSVYYLKRKSAWKQYMGGQTAPSGIQTLGLHWGFRHLGWLNVSRISKWKEKTAEGTRTWWGHRHKNGTRTGERQNLQRFCWQFLHKPSFCEGSEGQVHSFQGAHFMQITARGVTWRRKKSWGSTDKSDQHQAYYPVGHQNKKWWHYIFHSFVNLCIMQAYLSWEWSPHNPAPKKTYGHLWFCVDITEQLRAWFTSRKHAMGHSRAVPETPIAIATINHQKQVKTEGRPKVCHQCSQHGCKTTKGWAVETSYKCTFCHVPLSRHKNDRFRAYHGTNISTQIIRQCK